MGLDADRCVVCGKVRVVPVDRPRFPTEITPAIAAKNADRKAAEVRADIDDTEREMAVLYREIEERRSFVTFLRLLLVYRETNG